MNNLPIWCEGKPEFVLRYIDFLQQECTCIMQFQIPFFRKGKRATIYLRRKKQTLIVGFMQGRIFVEHYPQYKLLFTEMKKAVCLRNIADFNEEKFMMLCELSTFYLNTMCEILQKPLSRAIQVS